MTYSVGQSEINLADVVVRPKKRIRAKLYSGGVDGEANFHLLEEDRAKIEADLVCALNRKESPERQYIRIAVYFDGTDPDDRAKWPR